MNAVEIEQTMSDLALQPFDAAEFPFAFLAVFGYKETNLERLHMGNSSASDLAGGLLLRNHIHLAVCEPGMVGDILRARDVHFPKTIGDLYAHERSDEVLARIHLGRRFRNDTERLEKLFDLYTKMTVTAAQNAPVKQVVKRKKA